MSGYFFSLSLRYSLTRAKLSRPKILFKKGKKNTNENVFQTVGIIHTYLISIFSMGDGDGKFGKVFMQIA